ncbi:hypothetical protein GN956_G9088 [Arapaima gigas]
MALKVVTLLTSLQLSVCAARFLEVQERERMETLLQSATDGHVECFTDYMELWVHRTRIEGLRLWLSGVLRIPVSLVSLEELNGKLSACGFSLYRDADGNFVFRVLYSGCFVQLQDGSYAVALRLTDRVSRRGGRSGSFVMKCPLVTAPPGGEHIRCDPDFIQVTRKIPTDNWNKELPWSLALKEKLVVALEDASLIRLSVETDGDNVTVQGRRAEILTPAEVSDGPGGFLPLRLVSGHYSYSMEASCPTAPVPPTAETVLTIYKRRMGLVKRRGGGEQLSLSGVSVRQTDAFSVSESSDCVRIALDASRLLTAKSCRGPAGEQLVQPFFRVDAVLTFRETPHRLLWSVENLFPCTEMPNWKELSSSLSLGPLVETYTVKYAGITGCVIIPVTSSHLHPPVPETTAPWGGSGGAVAPSAGRMAGPASQLPSSAAAWLLPKVGVQSAASAGLFGTSSVVTVPAPDAQQNHQGGISGDPSGDPQGTQVLGASKGVPLMTPKHESKLPPSVGSPLIFGRPVTASGSPGAERREQSPEPALSSLETPSTEVKDSGGRTPAATVGGLGQSPQPASAEGAGWLSAAKRDILIPRPQRMTVRDSSFLSTATSGVGLSPKADVLQDTNSTPAQVTQGANPTGFSVNTYSSDGQGTQTETTWDLQTSHTHVRGTRALGGSTQGLLLTVPKHKSYLPASGEPPLLSGHPNATTGNPLVTSTTFPSGSPASGSAFKTSSGETSAEMLLVVQTKSSPSSANEGGAGVLRITPVTGQAEPRITSPEPRSPVDSSSWSGSRSAAGRGTKEHFLQKTSGILGNLISPATPIEREPGVATAPPSLPSTSSSQLPQLKPQSPNPAGPSETSPSLKGSSDVREHLGSSKAVPLMDSPPPDTHRTPKPAESTGVQTHIVANTGLRSSQWDGGQTCNSTSS